MCIDEYVSNLPPIYHDILAAFPATYPNRNEGHGSMIQALESTLTEQEKGHDLGKIMAACNNMAECGILVFKQRYFVCPTAKGEELISKITGRPVPSSDVPPIEPHS